MTDTDRDKQTHRRTTRQAHRHTERHSSRQTDGQTHRQNDGETGRWTDSKINRQSDGQAVRQKDRQTRKQTSSLRDRPRPVHVKRFTFSTADRTPQTRGSTSVHIAIISTSLLLGGSA